MRTILLVLMLLVTSCATRSVSWTPELIEATQRDFNLHGTWRHTVREGAEFGKRCDFVFESDGTYRKSCKPPVEESGEWVQVGEWDGHTFTIALSERVDLIEKTPVDDAEFVISVDSTKNDIISFRGETYERL